MPYTYVVTFRIADTVVGGRTREQRSSDLDARLKAHAGAHDIWFDTTSFFLIRSNEDTFSIGKRLSDGLSSQHDMLLVFDPSDLTAFHYGDIADPDGLERFFSSVKSMW